MILLKVLRKIYLKLNEKHLIKDIECERNPDIASNKIIELLGNNKACMIARFGSTELTCIANYLSVQENKKDILGYIRGDTYPWLWEKNIILQMQQWSGFFPAEIDYIEKFCELIIKDVKEVDLLGSWLKEENLFSDQIKVDKKVRLTLLDPYWSKEPWTKALRGKKVLVVHPFKKTIENQYKKRKHLFENEDVLPEFKALTVIQAVQSIAGNKTEFNNWFDALEHMKSQIDKIDYDICLISAGAYGFPLAAHVKRKGKKAVHMGGSLQLLFGIKGKRWEDPNYSKDFNYSELMNEYWVKPSDNDKPKKANIVENACYW